MWFSSASFSKNWVFSYRNKQIVAKRLSIAGANVAYNVQSNPTNGPFPTELSIQPGAAVTVTYDQEFTYDNSEISGFSICCKDYSECDYYQDAWKVLDRYHGKKDSSTSIMVNIQDVCGQNSPTGLAYLWEDTPTKRMIGLPIYSNDRFQLPAAPWKYELDKTPKF